MVQRDQVGDSAERDEVEQRRKIRFGDVRGNEPAAAPQARTQGQQQVEHDADAGEVLQARVLRANITTKWRSLATLLKINIGIHHRIGIRKRRSRQVMIGDDDADSTCPCCSNSGVSGDAVVDRDQQVGTPLRQFFDEQRTQTIAVHGAIRYAVSHFAGAEQAQPAQCNGGAGGAVTVEVTDHDDALARTNRVGNDRAGTLETAKVRRQHSGQPVIDMRGCGHAARREDPPQHRMHRQLDKGCRHEATDDSRRFHTSAAAGSLRQKRQRWPWR